MGFVYCAYRSFEHYDEKIDPGPEPDAHEIAARVAGAMRRAYETGEPQNVMLHTVRLGADLWRQYALRFDPEHAEVAVRIGPVVDTGQVPLPGWVGGHGPLHAAGDAWADGHGPPHCVGGLAGEHGTPHCVGSLQVERARR
jgi:hypothetical protein